MGEFSSNNQAPEKNPQGAQEGLWRFASHVILEVEDFTEFAVAVMDFMGRADEIVFLLYKELSKTPITCRPPDGDVTLETLERWYSEFEKEKKERRRLEKDVGLLLLKVESFRSSDRFKEMRDFIGRFKSLAPYNAYLVGLQKPGAMFVFNPAEWWERGRRPKANAQQLITLFPFGPVRIMFEYSDTEEDPDAKRTGRKIWSEAELIEEFDKSLNKATGEVDPREYENLLENLPHYGIFLDDKFSAANTYGGYIMRHHSKINLKLGGGVTKEWYSEFIISVNRNQNLEANFHTLCHELGHLFCRHLFYKPYEERELLTRKEREFEAETVAWLVAKRHGVKNPSEEYLAGYAPSGKIPLCDTKVILDAVREIEKMLKDVVPLKQTLWYRNDKDFQKLVDDFSKNPTRF